MTGPTTPDPTPTTPTGDWQPLDRRTVAASTLAMAGMVAIPAIPVLIGLLLAGTSPGWSLFWTLGSVLVLALATFVGESIRVRVTSYRLDADRIERRLDFIGSTHTSLARDRIRNVELAADVVQRLLGIVEVRLATGDGEGERFKLQALDRRTAEALRVDLLGDRATMASGELARFHPGWVRFAPLTIATPLLGLAAYGIVLQVADWFSAVPTVIGWLRDRLGEVHPALLVIGGLVLAVLVGMIATAAGFIEGWWRYRLERRTDGSLELHRGLLMNRTTHFQGERVRGVRLQEPLGQRLAGAARLDVIAVGVKGDAAAGPEEEKQSPALVPASPREVPVTVAEAILGVPWPDTLTAHPPGARRRRLNRAGWITLAGLVVGGVVALLWPVVWWIAPLTAAVAAAIAFPLALDNARGLGHRIDPDRIYLRRGGMFRSTDALFREGLLGWNLTQSPFQRRLGLASVIATSAGGPGAFRLPDVDADQARTLMDTAGPVWDHLRVPAHTPTARIASTTSVTRSAG
ncbi:PH domain-containing protein [Granulicoccus phenolivorans]|uniref:PH domain-containing protein n=1 Tax=Granulicoccus phenolivorans TaxID=266854 RepID=UPI0003FEB7F8|nr:PH domain-containing protein [Granulicoccus phenolivorans]